MITLEFVLKNFENAITVTRIANIHYFEFTNEYSTKNDKHNFCELIYVDNGEIVIKADNYSGLLKKGQAIIHLPMEKHSLKCINSDAPNIIIIGFECNCDKLNYLSHAPFNVNSEQQKRLTEIIKEGRNVFLPPYDIPYLKDMKKRESFPFGSDQLIKIYLEALLINFIRSYEQTNIEITSSNYEKIDEICEYINKNYCEHISLDDLCFIFNSNKTTICNSFKAAHNMTVVEYINRLKLKKAKQLLREGNRNITEISSKLGFSSVHYFCRFFKKQTNLTPSEYIKSIKSKLEI